MSTEITTYGVHHLTLIVTDIERSRDFYTSLLNFTVFKELPRRYVLTNGSAVLGLSLPIEEDKAIPNDRFSFNRVGLDHLSFAVVDRAELDRAVSLLDERGVEHGQITDLPEFGITILTLNDPDGIQLELAAPLGK